ncbi:MAG: hypothetical protein K8R38_09010 [Verrucomicrobia bacterium]|nr:hypothetical protein [Verrucomicrobiota bacterium]
MPRKPNPAKLALQKYTGLSRQAVDKRFKAGVGTTTFHDHLCRKMKATADLMEEKALAKKIEVAALRESLITREQVKHDCKMVSQIWCEEIKRMRGEAVAELVNLDEIGVRQKLDILTDDLMGRIMVRMEKL